LQNDHGTLASTKDMFFEVKEIGESGNRMRMPGFKGGIGEESEHVANSQSAGKVREVG